MNMDKLLQTLDPDILEEVLDAQDEVLELLAEKFGKQLLLAQIASWLVVNHLAAHDPQIEVLLNMPKNAVPQ